MSLDTNGHTDSLSEEDLMNQIQAEIVTGNIDLYEIMASATHARRSRGIDAEHFSKFWKIDLDSVRRTIKTTTQNSIRSHDPKLSRNYGANDRMLQYTRIKDWFFMDTFFATKKAGKSSRGNACCQLFVTDKRFVYVVPLKSQTEVLQAVKQFAKEIGAPDAIICDGDSEQKSHNLKKFLGDISTTLQLIEEGTPWSNKAELYIMRIKKEVHKDMKISNFPLDFWDYCVQQRARVHNMTNKDTFQL